MPVVGAIVPGGVDDDVGFDSRGGFEVDGRCIDGRDGFRVFVRGTNAGDLITVAGRVFPGGRDTELLAVTVGVMAGDVGVDVGDPVRDGLIVLDTDGD